MKPCAQSIAARLIASALPVWWAVLPTHAAAQLPAWEGRRLDAGGVMEVGGEAERYWRALQLAGKVPFQPMGIRPVDGLAPSRDSVRARWAELQLLRPGARVTWNSALPAGSEVGPAWTGRGITGELRAGAIARLWRVHLQLEPVAWWAQNQRFALVQEGASGVRDPRFTYTIDLPQRMGQSGVGRAEPGNSAAWLALPAVDLGVSTRAQAWGPAREYPLMLSANAGGFPHLFVGTRGGVPLGVGRLHARMIGGAPAQSRWSPMPDSTKRWAVGVAATFAPRGLPGLEVGFTRFIHALSESRWPAAADYRRLFTGGLSGTGALNLQAENQLASAFFRWQVPRARFAAYGELLRDDYSLDLRRGLQYPDDLRTFMLGVERVLRADANGMRVFHVELVNGELPSSNRVERAGFEDVRQFPAPFPPYTHGTVLQGHTQLGQVLGSPTAFGGAGWRVGYTAFTPAGRRSLRLERQMRLDWLPGLPGNAWVSREVRYGAVVEQLRFRGRQELLLTVAPSVDLNRGLERGHHRFNLRLAAAVRGLR